MSTYRDGTTHNALTGGTWQLDARRVTPKMHASHPPLGADRWENMARPQGAGTPAASDHHSIPKIERG